MKVIEFNRFEAAGKGWSVQSLSLEEGDYIGILWFWRSIFATPGYQSGKLFVVDVDAWPSSRETNLFSAVLAKHNIATFEPCDALGLEYVLDDVQDITSLCVMGTLCGWEVQLSCLSGTHVVNVDHDGMISILFPSGFDSTELLGEISASVKSI